MDKIKVGFAMCGSFCTFKNAINVMRELSIKGYDIIPIMSKNAYTTDTRFGNCDDINKEVELICNNKIISTINDAEPIGPKKMLDILVVAPCTGNTLAKITHAITDTSVTMAVKSHLRTGRNVLLAIATNDALGNSAQNIGKALNIKNIYFVPFSQDDPINKPNSLIADFNSIEQCLKLSLINKQIQPILGNL